MDLTRWSISKSDRLCSIAKDGEALYNQQKTRLGADCGSDHEFLIAKFRLKLKKVGKTTTVEVTNRFKGLDLIDRVPEELWMEVHDITPSRQ